MLERRHDIDWIRVIAIGLLMVYHVAIVFQPWGLMIGFITNTKNWESLWLPMSFLNVWRIPILFFIAGMGLYFSFRNRSWKEVLKERLLRIGLPFAFGFVVIAPVYVLILQKYYDWKFQYIPQVSHLWFLGNILCYLVLAIASLYYIRKVVNNNTIVKIRRALSGVVILPIIIVCFVVETIIVNPPVYEMYAETIHGFFLGLLAFVFGIVFAFLDNNFWKMLTKYRWLFLYISVFFFTIRVGNYFDFPQRINMPVETCLWIFTVFAFANKYLNFSNIALSYLSKAAYPVYIIHMIFLGLSCMTILPLTIQVQLKFLMVMIGTTTGSLLFYEFIIKRNKYIGTLFGIIANRKQI